MSKSIFVHGKVLHPSLMFVGMPGAYHRVEYLKGASFSRLLAISTNTRIGGKGMPGTNTLAYYGNP
jgi:hypothetical protein